MSTGRRVLLALLASLAVASIVYVFLPFSADGIDCGKAIGAYGIPSRS